jgi:transketolase
MVTMKSFGASAPLKDLQTKFGFNPEAIVQSARDQIARCQKKG